MTGTDSQSIVPGGLLVCPGIIPLDPANRTFVEGTVSANNLTFALDDGSGIRREASQPPVELADFESRKLHGRTHPHLAFPESDHRARIGRFTAFGEEAVVGEDFVLVDPEGHELAVPAQAEISPIPDDHRFVAIPAGGVVLSLEYGASGVLPRLQHLRGGPMQDLARAGQRTVIE
jgi:hypothetical protein